MAIHRYRVYFNAKKEAPQVCSIDMGSHDSEIIVQGAEFHAVMGKCHYQGDKEYPEPKFWLEFYARMELVGSIAHFWPI